MEQYDERRGPLGMGKRLVLLLIGAMGLPLAFTALDLSPATVETQRDRQAESRPQKRELESEAERRATLRKQRLDRVSSYAERVGALPDSAFKIDALSWFGSALCAHDPSEGEKWFLRAYESFKRLIANEEAGTETKSSARGAWNRLVFAARGCSATLAKRLEASFAAHSDTQILQVRAAASSMFAAFRENDLEKTIQSAADILTKGGSSLYTNSPGSASNRDLTQLVGALNQLHSKDSGASDRLFAQALGLARQSPVLDVNNLLALGLYLYGAPEMMEHPDAVTYRRVGGVPTLDVSASRAGRSEEMRRLYLETAIAILSQPIHDPTGQAQYYLAARQLLPRVRESLPARAGSFEGGISLLGAQLPETLTRADFLERLGGPYDADANEEEKAAEAETDASRRDERFALAAMRMITANKFSRARELAAKIRDTVMHRTMQRTIGLREADHALARMRPDHAERAAAQMPPGAERAIVYVGIGEAFAKNDPARARDFANLALADAPAVKDLAPYILLASAALMAKLDGKAGTQLFDQAVVALNSRRAASADKKVPMGVFLTVKIGRFTRIFPMRAGTAIADLSVAVQALAKADFQATEAAALNLTSDEMLAACLRRLAERLLANLERPDL